MLLIIAAVFLFKKYSTLAAPLLAPETRFSMSEDYCLARNPVTDGYHTRTVWSIVWGCLTTTIACTWVTIHPNVPFRNEGTLEINLRRLYLMFFSFLAPEFMAMWSYKQMRGAEKIRDEMNEILRIRYPGDTSKYPLS